MTTWTYLRSNLRKRYNTHLSQTYNVNFSKDELCGFCPPHFTQCLNICTVFCDVRGTRMFIGHAHNLSPKYPISVYMPIKYIDEAKNVQMLNSTIVVCNKRTLWCNIACWYDRSNNLCLVVRKRMMGWPLNFWQKWWCLSFLGRPWKSSLSAIGVYKI